MNLPYTMTVASAADAVLEFKPKTIYPYHYRGTDGLSDINEFKTLIKKGNQKIEVVQLDWYPKK
jgi:L-ascorbate metabolism protein UlaG (beta-lactamase superfamily)